MILYLHIISIFEVLCDFPLINHERDVEIVSTYLHPTHLDI